MQAAIYHYFAYYGVQTTFGFATQDFTDVDDLYIGTAWAADDAKISKDYGAVVSTTNTPAQITASQPIHKIVLTATEMQASEIIVTIRDQTEAEVFEPVVIHITTSLTLGTVYVSPLAGGLATDAVSLTAGTGGNSGLRVTAGSTGHGAIFSGGTTSGDGIRAVASTSGQGIYGIGAGTGAGVAGLGGNTSGSGIGGVGGTSGAGIAGAAGSGGVLCNLFDTVLTAEPTTAFASTDTYGKSIARLMRRFYNKVTQTVSLQKQYKDDSTTVVDTMAVSDDATTQTKGKST